MGWNESLHPRDQKGRFTDKLGAVGEYSKGIAGGAAKGMLTGYAKGAAIGALTGGTLGGATGGIPFARKMGYDRGIRKSGTVPKSQLADIPYWSPKDARRRFAKESAKGAFRTGARTSAKAADIGAVIGAAHGGYKGAKKVKAARAARRTQFPTVAF